MEIIDIDELVPDDITFKYRGEEWTIPGDLRTDQTLELYALLRKLALTEAKGDAAELGRIVAKAETALLPIFQVHHPDLDKLPFGAAGLGVVLRTVLRLIGLLEAPVAAGEGEPVDPPNRAARRARSTRTPTKPGSKPRPKRKPRTGGGSTRSKS